MSSRVMVLETYGGVHLPGVWSRNGHGGGSGALFQRVLITFPLLSLLPFYYSVSNSDPQIKTVFYSLVLKPQIADINYQDVL